jgi:hypothetical protein
MTDFNPLTPEFVSWGKIPRLNRDIVITEKIDGTNAAIGVLDDGTVYAQSRKKIITPEADNAGFARWVSDNDEFLRTALGPGLHFGEWWGQGIQRRYGLDHKRFSLFNTARWNDFLSVDEDFSYEDSIGLHVVPTLYAGPFSEYEIGNALATLDNLGSQAAPGFLDPEGIIIFHTAANSMFKVTLKDDEKPKGSNE